MAGRVKDRSGSPQSPTDLPRRGRGADLVTGFALGVAFAGLFAKNDTFREIISALWPEIFSIVFTVGVLGWFAHWREVQADKRRLIEELGSRVQDVAVYAAEKLRRRGWLTDGSLQEARLWEANLHNANLQRAYLASAHLEGANLRGANLGGAVLPQVHLEGANLHNANLQRAYLASAHLEGANLRGANLQMVLWPDAEFDEDTTLPDGTKWMPGTDMDRFTDPDHPDFWRSSVPPSPAYRGDAPAG
jgi:hypothetical protein